MTAKWTDPRGTRRHGELLDQVTIQHPTRGEVTGLLYADRSNPSKHVFRFELWVGLSNTERAFLTQAEGETFMAKFREAGK